MRSKENPYDPATAQKSYVIGKDFEHLSMQEPTTVKKQYSTSKHPQYHHVTEPFEKSYTVMNRVPGEPLDKDVHNFMEYFQPNTSMVIKQIILPVLEAYKNQIAEKGLVFRDIKFENIHSNLKLDAPSEIYFMDVDEVRKVGEPDSNFGSPSFIAPEVAGMKNNEVLLCSQARDIYSLGVLLMGAINTNLDLAIGPLKEMTSQEAVEMFYLHTLKNKRIDINELLYESETGQQFNLFDYLSEEPHAHAIRAEMQELIEKMTSLDPNDRPDINQVISGFQNILSRMELIEKEHLVEEENPPLNSSTANLVLGLSEKNKEVAIKQLETSVNHKDQCTKESAHHPEADTVHSPSEKKQIDEGLFEENSSKPRFDR